jgi:hypothetical protein
MSTHGHFLYFFSFGVNYLTYTGTYYFWTRSEAVFACIYEVDIF